LVATVKPLRVGVIGTGFGQHHIRGFTSIEGVEVVTICNSSGKRLDEIAKEYGVPQTCRDYRKVFQDPTIDIVSIATPVHLHATMVHEALDAGKHVLSEKPLALTADDAHEMWQHAERAQLKHMTNFIFRFVPASFQVQALIAEGRIGKPFHINIRHMIPSQLDPNRPLGWRHVRAKAGMGAMGDLGVHNIDLVRWWLGDFRRVAAVQQPMFAKRRLPDSEEQAAVDVDDMTMVIGELESGASAAIHVSRCAAGGVSMEAEVCGDLGSIRFTRSAMRFARATDSDHEDLPIEPRFLDAPSSYASFIQAVRDDTSPEPSFFDGWKVQQVADAVVRSGDAGGAWQTVG